MAGKAVWADRTVRKKAELRFWVKNFTQVVGNLSILKLLLVLIPLSFQDQRGPWLIGVRSSEAPQEKRRLKPAIFKWLQLIKLKE